MTSEVEIITSNVSRQRRRGRYRKIHGIGAVRCKEHYLRSDESVLLVRCVPSTSAADSYLVPDADVLRTQLDVLEDAAFGCGQVLLLLQTVLEQLTDLTQRQQRRLFALLRGHSGGWNGALLFFNEHFCGTYLYDTKARGPNRDVHAIEIACRWCRRQLCNKSSGDTGEGGGSGGSNGRGGMAPDLVLLTSRPQAFTDLRGAARLCTVDAFIEGSINSAPDRRRLKDLADAAAATAGASLAMLAPTAKTAAATAAVAAAAPPVGALALAAEISGRFAAAAGDVYSAHLAPTAVAAGLASGVLLDGMLDVYEHNPGEAVVLASSGSSGIESGAAAVTLNDVGGGNGAGAAAGRIRVLVVGRAAMNRAMHGDIVAVRLLPPSQWRAPTTARRLTQAAAVVDDGDTEALAAAGAGTEVARSSGAMKNSSDMSGKPSDTPFPPRDALPTGVVVSILRRGWRPLVATIPAEDTAIAGSGVGGDAPALAVPMDLRLPKLRLRTRQLRRLAGRRLVLSIDDWPADSLYPNGHYLRTLGPVGDVRTEVSALLVEFGADFGPFGAAALACLPKAPRPPPEPQAPPAALADAAGAAQEGGEGPKAPFFEAMPWADSGWRVTEEEARGRRDLRGPEGPRVFSVDPRGCQDIDDAMHVRRLADGSLEVGVHIADVTNFLRLGGPLDREARRRGTTVYLVHRRYDMLPALLSSDVCSLHGNVDRLAVSVIWQLPPLKEKKRSATAAAAAAAATAGEEDLPFQLPPRDSVATGTWVGRTVIRSCAAMTYDQADELLRTGSLDPCNGGMPPPPAGQAGGPVAPELQAPLAEDLWMLTRVTRALRRRREEAGALDLSTEGGELKFRLDAETGEPVAVASKVEAEIHHTIAELMILANAAVAEITAAAFPTAALLRCHGAPAPDSLGSLVEVAAAAGVNPMKGVSGKELEATLKAVSRQGSSGGDKGREPEPAGAGDAPAAALAKSIAIRAMAEAQYVSSGDLDHPAAQNNTFGEDDANQTPKEGGGDWRFGHFGLQLQHYTHFTSPIRRYADVVVHRLLLAAIAKNTAAASGSGGCGTSKSCGAFASALAAPAGRGAGVAIPPSLVPSVLDLAPPPLASGESERALGSEKLTRNPDGTRTYDKVAIMPRAAAPPAAAPAPAAAMGDFDDDDGDALVDALLAMDEDPDEPLAEASVAPTPAHILKVGEGAAGGGGRAGRAGSTGATAALEAGGSSAGSGGVQNGAEDEEEVGGGKMLAMSAGLPGPPFSGPELREVCKHLNEQSRRAKRLSQRCQELFLRLYFAHRGAESNMAVVCALRTNGVLVYIPKYDVRAPVFFCDRSGVVQLDPVLVGLPVNAGNPPSGPFEALKGCRALPGWSLRLSEPARHNVGTVLSARAAAAALEVVPPHGAAVAAGGSGTLLSLRILDVITVNVSCEVMPSQARLPRLQLHITAGTAAVSRKGKSKAVKATGGGGGSGGGGSSSDSSGEVKSGLSTLPDATMTKDDAKSASPAGEAAAAATAGCGPSLAGAASTSLYADFQRSLDAAITPVPCFNASGAASSAGAVGPRALCRSRVERMRGRVSFCGFETVESEVSLLRGELRDQYGEEEGGGYGDASDGGGSSILRQLDDRRVQEYQREALARQQRLRAERRHYKKPNN